MKAHQIAMIAKNFQFVLLVLHNRYACLLKELLISY